MSGVILVQAQHSYAFTPAQGENIKGLAHLKECLSMDPVDPASLSASHCVDSIRAIWKHVQASHKVCNMPVSPFIATSTPQRHLLTHQCYSLTLRSTKLRYSWSTMPRSCSLGYKCAPAPAVTRHNPQPTHTHIHSWAASSCKQHASV